MRRQVQSQQQFRSWGEIAGRQYNINDGVAKRVLQPGEQPGRDVHATVPHPDPTLRVLGYRIAFVFLSIIVLACVATMILEFV